MVTFVSVALPRAPLMARMPAPPLLENWMPS
jgi:hypothetical protein